MRRSAEFARAFRGVRGGSARLLVAIGLDLSSMGLANLSLADADPTENTVCLPPKVGFVVPKSVGNSVVRHRLYRQLRHLMRVRIGEFRHGELVAVRAFPPASGASSQELAEDVDRCIASARRKQKVRRSVGASKEPTDCQFFVRPTNVSDYQHSASGHLHSASDCPHPTDSSSSGPHIGEIEVDRRVTDISQ